MTTRLPRAIEGLFTRMGELFPTALYPPHVLPVPDCIPGTAFFPGGCGLFLEDRDADKVEFPYGGLMILGHNFDSEIGFGDSLRRGKENLNGGTWAGTLKRINSVPVPLPQCFFTNAFMGLCEGSDNTKYLGRGDGRFRAACAAFLKSQISIQKPRLIVTLGLKVPPLLATISSDLEPWQGSRKRINHDRELKTTAINAHPILTATIELDDGSKHRAVVVPITHPGEGRNLKHRGWPDGLQGEIDLIKRGWIMGGKL